MGVPCFQVDSFASRAFRGNPAAVCLLDRSRPAAWMQSVAAEMNLSETAFVAPLKSGFKLRWFTPTTEVDLCGHATLATAHVLWAEGVAPEDAELAFQTRSGTLTARRHGTSRIELDFPARPELANAPVPSADVVQRALGAKPKRMAAVAEDLVVELGSERIVRNLAPDMQLVAGIDARGVVVTARAKERYDFVSRFFGPRVGVPEDPVTGSAHCALAPYWAKRLGKTRMKAFQASARGGEVALVVADNERVLLRGAAVTTLRGQLVC
ncbi:MAG: PhzF family phenazine biosynthesis protein [Planctomycetota bacterium]